MQQKHYTHLLWDFNGTLLNDVDACVRCANRLLTAHGLPPLSSVAAYRDVFGFPIIEYYRRLGLDLDRLPYTELAPEWVRYYLEEVVSSELYDGITETLTAVRALGISQWVLSATELQMLTQQLDTLGIRSYFDGILGLGNIHAYSKEEIALDWKRTHPDATVLMFGDTDHDAAVAAAIHADCVLLTTGHQPRARLENNRCLFVADSAAEALQRLSEGSRI